MKGYVDIEAFPPLTIGVVAYTVVYRVTTNIMLHVILFIIRFALWSCYVPSKIKTDSLEHNGSKISGWVSMCYESHVEQLMLQQSYNLAVDRCFKQTNGTHPDIVVRPSY